MLRAELARLFAALRYFTRIPVPAWVGHDQDQLDRSVRYFPLIGILVGFVGAVVTWLAWHALPGALAVALGMAATVLLTGAFHEDGFADSCDGFGGGWTREDVLRIMKDSRLGSYGAIALVLMLLCKWNALIALGAALPATLLAAHASSRAYAASLIAAMDYVRDEDARAKPLATRLSGFDLGIAWVFGVLPCLLLPWQVAVIALWLAGLTAFAWARYSRRRIGGYTGDVLGACQQLCELAFYLGVLGSMRFVP